jgi:hypothetical protein
MNFEKTDFEQAANYAVSQLSSTEYEYALDFIKYGGQPISRSEIASTLSDAMSEWCEDNGFDGDIWMFDYSLDDVILFGNRPVEAE